jgi:secretion/DNA translocation related TadE-like protein
VSHRDAGSATVLALGLACVLAVTGAAAIGVGGAAAARHRAASAADLAALAAAGSLDAGPPGACAAARRTAGAAGADVVTCAVAGRTVTVVAEVRPGGVLGRLGTARARARAGPVGEVDASPREHPGRAGRRSSRPFFSPGDGHLRA